MISHKKITPKEKTGKDTGLAKKLNTLLKKHSLTKSEFAQVLKLPLMTVHRLLSGETQDPRLSTLKLIAKYFDISIDTLTDDSIDPAHLNRTSCVPLLNWETLQEKAFIDNMDFSDWQEWQALPRHQSKLVSTRAFALPSRPSMYSRYPQGTLFIIDPEATPIDGDIVLVNIRGENEMTLRKLFIDPPHSKLQSLTHHDNAIAYSKKDQPILGVNILTLLFNRKDNTV